MVTVDDVRSFAKLLPRTTEALVRDRIKFRVGRIVYVAFSRDETLMGFGFPKDERDALVASEPHKFQLPSPADMRYQWVVARLDALDLQEMRELVLEAWRMCVPKKLSAQVGLVSDAWQRWRSEVDLDEYEARFVGADAHGEADLVASMAPATVLDAGCGTGRVAVELARRGIDVVGVDADPEMLARAVRHHPELTWVLADLAALELERRFDVVVMAGNVLPFVSPDERVAVVARCARHLDAGGRLVVGAGLRRGWPTIAELDEWCRDAGLESTTRFATWRGEIWSPGADYAVSIYS